jgi:hypothetical protein
MSPSNNLVTVVVSVALQDAGEATRSLEIMKAVRSMAPNGYSIRGIFFSHGSKFDDKVIENGFEIYNVKPSMEGKGYLTDLKPSATNFIGNPELAVELLKGEIEALEVCRPNYVLHGFWPMASLARRMVSPSIEGICFLPLPLAPSLYGSYLMKDVPDQIKPLTFLPLKIRRIIMNIMPASFVLKAPILRQTNILNAAKQCGWSGRPLFNLFDLLKADLTIVNDLMEFYKNVPIPTNYIITGPLYAQSVTDLDVTPEINAVFQKNNDHQVNIFCTMGSSAKKEFLLEAVQAIASLPDNRFHAVILAPCAICSIAEIIPFVKNHPNIYVTDQFVPATRVNAMADITLCHGGQGTIQTAMISGSPIIGFAMQPEQQINLDHIVSWGAGIRLPITRWSRKNIISAIKKLLSDNSYKECSVQLGKIMAAINGELDTAKVIWKFMKDNFVKE